MAPPKRIPPQTGKRKLLIFVSVAILGGAGYIVGEKNARTAEGAVAKTPSPRPAVSPRVSPTGGFGATMGALPEPNGTTPPAGETTAPAAASTETVPPPAKPRPELLADGKVRTVMAPGETLVTGGYLNTDGKWEFAMVTASVLEGTGGKQLKLSSSVIALNNDSVHRAGLGTLLTGEVETRQHGEVWKAGEAQRIFKDLEESKGSELLSAPTMVIQGGSEGGVQIGDEDGVLFKFGTKVVILPDGNLDLTFEHKRQARGK